MSEDVDSRARARVGTLLDGKWSLERLLGTGGMAAVYEARHRNGARAAVKILHADLARNAEVRLRFVREGYAANRVEHPGAVKVLDDDVVADGPDKGSAYLVMELLEGESLQDRLERAPPLGELEVLKIVDEVLDVLDAAHSRGVVHRDLKPENLFLARDAGGAPGHSRVKVLDFGLARLLEGQSITTYGLALGTPSFMSPEQAAGRVDEIDGRTDLFALAATGFRIRSGRRIHEEDNAVELVLKMAKVPAPRLATVCSDVSEPFARVIDRALEFRREDRYESAAAMRKDVRRAIEQLEDGASTARVAPAPPAAPPPGTPAAPRGEATIELTGGDVETMPRVDDESIRLPRRRSMIPWVALLMFLGIGAKLGFEAWKVHVSVLEAPGAPSAPQAAGGADAMMPDATPRVPLSTAPAASAPHRAPAPKASPSSGHGPSPKIVRQ